MKTAQTAAIQSLWIGTTLSIIEQLCIRSFLANGHEFHLYSYETNLKNCPDGVILKDANEIVPHERVYKDIAQTYTSFANWFRYKLLFMKGGWWVDMDVVCLKYFNFNQDYCFTTEMITDTGVPQIITNNAVIKAPQKAEFLHEMIVTMEKTDLKNARWGTFGSRFLEQILKNYESENYIQPMYVFCPINWHQIELFFVDNLDMTFEHCHAIHLWNNIWSKRGISKHDRFGDTALIEKLKRMYL
ncbi:glycosyltransferase [Niabella sp. CJ426]|uniref:glycosyltransferase n=1 Tax=Niabella sp. CJ426 TaxID=3393740 RepID=UPI003CFE0C38